MKFPQWRFSAPFFNFTNSDRKFDKMSLQWKIKVWREGNDTDDRCNSRKKVFAEKSVTNVTQKIKSINWQWKSRQCVVQIFGNSVVRGNKKKSVRPRRREEDNKRHSQPVKRIAVTKCLTAGGLQMPQDYGFYPPTGYWSYCARRMSGAKPPSLDSTSWLEDPTRGRARISAHLQLTL